MNSTKSLQWKNLNTPKQHLRHQQAAPLLLNFFPGAQSAGANFLSSCCKRVLIFLSYSFGSGEGWLQISQLGCAVCLSLYGDFKVVCSPNNIPVLVLHRYRLHQQGANFCIPACGETFSVSIAVAAPCCS